MQYDIRDNLSRADLKPIDLYLSAFGPALRVISEHWGTERETANMNRLDAPFAVTPTDALQVARAEVSKPRVETDWDGIYGHVGRGGSLGRDLISRSPDG